jgi:hypothetical protein
MQQRRYLTDSDEILLCVSPTNQSMNERHIIHVHVDGRTILPGEAVLGVLFR